MILPISNSTNIIVYNNKNIGFKQNQSELTKVIKPINETVKSNVKNFSFSSLLEKVANLFDRELEFDKYGNITKIEKYKNGKIEKVKLFNSKNLLRPYAIDEYKDGLISKTTTFYKSSRKPNYIIEYDSSGNNKIYEYYLNGKEKSFQYEKDDNIDSIAYFDENGNYIKGEKYNTDETLSSVTYYGDRQLIQESYSDGILSSKLVTFTDSNIQQNTVYDEKQNILYVMENGNNYSTYYHYTDGKKDWSETKYDNQDILYKKTMFDSTGKPKTEYFYDKKRLLCSKKEFNKDETIKTIFKKDGNIASIEILDNKTKKIKTIYK